MSQGPKQTTSGSSTQRQNPWDPAKPLLKDMIGGAQSWLRAPGTFQTYGGPTLGGVSDATKSGWNLMTSGQGYGEAADYYKSVLGGGGTAPDSPYLEGMKQSVINSVMPGALSQFAGSGQFGSALHQGTMTRALGDAVAPVVGSAYMAERDRQERAAGALPQLYGAQAAGYLGAGAAQDARSQAEADDARMRFEQRRMAGISPFMQLLPLAQGMGGMGGTTQQQGTTTQTTSQPWWQTAAGLGMTGLSIAGGFPGFGMTPPGPLPNPSSWPYQINR